MSNLKTQNLIEKILNGILFLIFLLPLFFLPITANFYDFNKNFLLYLGVGLLLLVWAGKIAAKGNLRWFKTSLDLPIFAFALVFVLATFFASPNKVEPFLTPGGTGTILALTIFYFLLTQLDVSRYTLNALVASASLLALVAVYQFLGLGEALISQGSNFAFMKAKFWTPAGDLLSLLMFLLVALPNAAILFKNHLSKNLLKSILFGVATILIIAGAGVTIFQLLPISQASKQTSFFLLPYPTSWAIAIETFKQNPLFGVGPANFISAFNRFRPVGFNRYDFWNLRFTATSSYLLHLLTETGILGLGAFLIIIITVIKVIKIIKEPLALGLGVALILLFFLPGNFLILFTFFVLLACLAPKTETTTLLLGRKTRWLPLVISCSLLAVSYFLAGRAYLAEIYFKKSLDALAKNDGLGTYNNQIKAISLNPRKGDFRIAYSQTNFALANSLATKKELTDQDRANISQLVQQAIQQAKVATVLNPTNSATWENLAQLYRNLINFAQGADQWALAAYQQAIITDPINPRLRLDLGGLFYALGNYDEAQKIFRTVVELKPDYANGWYNLAAAYREDQKYQQAYQAMQQTLALVPADSADWQKAKSELDELEKKIPKPSPTPSPEAQVKQEEKLTKPQPLPSPVLEKPIEIPQETKGEE